MFMKHAIWKYSIQKEVNGMAITVLNDSDMEAGFSKNAYMFMEAFN